MIQVVRISATQPFQTALPRMLLVAVVVACLAAARGAVIPCTTLSDGLSADCDGVVYSIADVQGDGTP